MTPPAIIVAGGTHLEFLNWCNESGVLETSPLVLHARYVQHVSALNLSRSSTLIVDLGVGPEGEHEHELLLRYLPARRRLP